MKGLGLSTDGYLLVDSKQWIGERDRVTPASPDQTTESDTSLNAPSSIARIAFATSPQPSVKTLGLLPAARHVNPSDT